MPESSVAWYRTKVVPSSKTEGAGPLSSEKVPELSVKTGAVKFTVALSDPRSGSTVVLDGHPPATGLVTSGRGKQRENHVKLRLISYCRSHVIRFGIAEYTPRHLSILILTLTLI